MKQLRSFSLFLCLLAFAISPSQAQTSNPDLYWSYIHDLPNSGFYYYSEFDDMVLLEDGSTIALGRYHDTLSAIPSGNLVHRIDKYGNAEWTLNLPSNYAAEGHIAQLDADNIVISNMSRVLYKVSNQGVLQWTDTLPAGPGELVITEGSEFAELIVDRDNQIVAGFNERGPSTTFAQSFPRVLILDSTRATLLDTTYSNLISNFGFYEINQLADGNYLLVGGATIGGLSRPYLIKISPNGTILWNTHIDNVHNTNSLMVRVFEKGSGDLFLLGSGWMTGYLTEEQTYMVRMDSNGDSLWTRSVGDSLPFMDVTEGANGDIYCLGTNNNFYPSDRMFRIDTSGTLVWNKDITVQNLTTYGRRIMGSQNGFSVVGKIGWTNRGFITHLDENGEIYGNIVSGVIVLDSSANCLPDSGEPVLTQALVKMEPGPYYTMTNQWSGEFELNPDSGNHWISLPNLPDLWDIACPSNPDSHFVSFSGLNDTLSNVNFALEPNYLCPYLEVSFSTWRLRKCREQTYVGRVKNWGTQTAINAYVEVELDTFMSVLQSPLGTINLGNNKYRVPLGDIGIWQTKYFLFDVMVSCGSVIGRTACSQVIAYPLDYCEPVSPLWDSAHVEVAGSCIPGDSVRFIISNTGTGNMNAASGILIAEDDILRIVGNVQLNAGQDTTIYIVGNGSTWTCMVDQVANHPGNSHPRAAVEACGLNTGGNYSKRFIGSVLIDDLDHFKDIDYQLIYGSCDPNDKTGQPFGTGDHHLINADDVIEYLIRFQNTGIDTAFKVVIRDQLPPELDLGTLQLGVSSHPYTFAILPNNTLEWTFDPIALPDSFVDEPGSNGFVKFTISQTPGNQPGDVIKNAADIYFDFNDAVITDTSIHTIADSTMQLAIVSVEPAIPGIELEAFPNPFHDQVVLRVKGANLQELYLELYDLQGRLVHKQASVYPDRIIYQRKNLPAGAYVFYLRSRTEMLGTGKLIAN